MITEQRFWSKVSKTNECWFWVGATDPGGYARFWVNRSVGYAHRYAYELLVGPIPSGLTIDHLCRVRHCVNPAHMETVTQRENVLRSPTAPPAINARKTHCSRGHLYPNRDENGWRRCRTCQRLAARRRRANSIVDRAGSPIKETAMKLLRRTRTTRIAGRLGIYGRFPRKRYWLVRP